MTPARPSGLAVVGDHEHGLVHRDLAPVEQRKRLARPRAAHDDAAVELAPVIGVHRLAELEHHVVGDVDHRADRTQAGATQALAASRPAPAPAARARGSRATRSAHSPHPAVSSTGTRIVRSRPAPPLCFGPARAAAR